VRRSELSGSRDQARWHGPHSRSSEAAPAAPGDQPAEAADELKPGASLTAKLSKEEGNRSLRFELSSCTITNFSGNRVFYQMGFRRLVPTGRLLFERRLRLRTGSS
jgi:hypothetical protein